MNPIAEQYVRLVLALGQHDADYVDAYYGPPEWRKDAEARKLALGEIVTRASALRSQLEASTPPANGEELVLLRHRYLQKQLSSLRSRAEMLAGARLSFDEESQALYDAVAPTVVFEKARLFPLAGLDASPAAEYGETVRLVEELAYARNEAARRYRDGLIVRAAAVAWLERHAMLPPPRAEQSLRFIERYGAYVINYNLGKDLVKTYVEQHGGTADQPLFRWREFERLISSPRLPSGLR